MLLLALGLLGLAGIGRAADRPAASPAEPGYTVVVGMKVNPDGSVADASVVRSENDFLSRLALATVRTWKLPPKADAGPGAAYRAEAPVFFPVEDDQGAVADAIPKPQPREVVRPVYPAHLRNSGQVGGAILEFTVDVTGRVRKPEVLRASHREFGEAARRALLLWRFYPAESAGTKVESRVRMAMVFETEATPADWRWLVPPRPAIASYVLTAGPE